MYNRSRYGRNNWYMAFFWAFIGFLLGQMAPQVSFSFNERSQALPTIQVAQIGETKDAQ